MRFSLGTARQWHWISAAVSLVGMLLFAVTGITLNHAAVIPASISVTTVESEVPADVLTHLQDLPMAEMLAPQPVRQWLASEHSISGPADVAGEFDGMEFYLAWPGPGPKMLEPWATRDASKSTMSLDSNQYRKHLELPAYPTSRGIHSRRFQVKDEFG